MILSCGGCGRRALYVPEPALPRYPAGATSVPWMPVRDRARAMRKHPLYGLARKPGQPKGSPGFCFSAVQQIMPLDIGPRLWHYSRMRKYTDAQREASRLRGEGWRKRNPDKDYECKRAWLKANPVKRKAMQKKADAKRGPVPPEVTRKRNRYYKYGVSPEDVAFMIARQKGTCAICPMLLSEKTAHVDHDHKTGKVRGLLCRKCNLGLGHFEDNPSFLVSAVSYLQRVVDR